MSYFREFPNLKYIGRVLDKNSLTNFVDAKNIFKRAKLREDIKNIITAFTLYQIEETERPEQIAKNFYNDPELDWVVLLTNNIINVNEEWPLDNNSFYKYLIDKYESDENIYKIHHYETSGVRDEFNRLVVPEGLIVDDDIFQEFTTLEEVDTYELNSFPNTVQPLIITLNLNQRIYVKLRTNTLVSIPITDIQIENSFINVPSRERAFTNITVNNSLINWPSGWSGSFFVLKRDGEMRIEPEDFVGEVPININNTLFEIVGVEENEELIPKIIFKRTLIQ